MRTLWFAQNPKKTRIVKDARGVYQSVGFGGGSSDFFPAADKCAGGGYLAAG
jgi:hypothetical protein